MSAVMEELLAGDVRRGGDGRAPGRPAHEGRDGRGAGRRRRGDARARPAVRRRAATTCWTPAAPAATARARSTSARRRRWSWPGRACRSSSTATAASPAPAAAPTCWRTWACEMTADAGVARRCLDEAGMAFCFAPGYHPALRHVGDVRRRLGVRTLFNCLGPLANPAGAAYQLLGVGRPEWLDRMAGALARLGHAARRPGPRPRRAGRGDAAGADPGPRGRGRPGRRGRVDARPTSACPAARSTSCARTARPASAAIIRGVLAGRDGPAAASCWPTPRAALLAAGRAESPAEGVALARQSLSSGKAAAVLAALVRITSRGVRPGS